MSSFLRTAMCVMKQISSAFIVYVQALSSTVDPETYRHDSNLALSRLDDARTIWSYQSGLILALQCLLYLHHIMLRDACKQGDALIRQLSGREALQTNPFDDVVCCYLSSLTLGTDLWSYCKGISEIGSYIDSDTSVLQTMLKRGGHVNTPCCCAAEWRLRNILQWSEEFRLC